MAITMGELLNKIDDTTHKRYRVHDDKGNSKWEKDIAYSLGRCTWMGSEEDILSYIEYIKEHNEN